MKTVISLGSNLGDRAENLNGAITELKEFINNLFELFIKDYSILKDKNKENAPENKNFSKAYTGKAFYFIKK